MAEMETRLVKEKKKMEVNERRRKTELEGYGSDLMAMRKKINFYQKYIGKLRKLVEEDQVVNFSEEDEEEYNQQPAENEYGRGEGI